MGRYKFDHLAAWIPGYGHYRWVKNIFDNVKKDGFQLRDLFGFLQDQGAKDDDSTGVVDSAKNIIDTATDVLNSHNVSSIPDVNGYQQVEISPADPTSSASNVINYDPNKSAMENMLGYAQANNSASAYNDYLQTAHNTEMSNTALSRAIADAERNGISKYQLFQSGNAAASTPSSGSSLATSYENAMNRRESWNEKELDAIVKIITTTISSALGVLGK